MTSSIPLSDLESGNAASFPNIGDSYAGTITKMEERQQTDTGGNALSWNDGSPRMLWVITIEQTNGEEAQLYAKGGKYKVASGEGESMLNAIGLAVRAANATGVDVGGQLAVVHTGLGEKTAKGGVPKLYKAQYKVPAPASIPADDLFADS
jgi:hypothetical protein